MKVSSLVNLELFSQAVPEARSWFYQSQSLPRVTKMCSVRGEEFHAQIPHFAELLKSRKIWSIFCGLSLKMNFSYISQELNYDIVLLTSLNAIS